MTYLLHFFIISLVYLLRSRHIDGRTSPDCDAYLGLTVGRPTQSPYRWRVFVPYLSRLFYWAGEPKDVLRAVVRFGNVLVLLFAYLLTLSFGGTPWQALAVCLILIGTNAFFGTWLILPWLVDSWGIAWALLACLSRGTPWLAALFLLMAAITKEYALVLGYVFLVSLNPSLWWTCLPGIAFYALLRLTLKASESGTDSILVVIKHVSTDRRRYWFDWKVILAGLHASPFVIAAILPLSPHKWTIAAVSFFAWLQLHIAFDRARLVAACLPFVIPLVALSTPDWVLSLWVLATLFWPFHSEWI
jgi:hypothetical protein